METLRERLVRPALLFEPSDANQETEDTGSFFGSVKVASPDETWPTCDGRPMTPLLQLNLGEIVFRPPGSEDVRMLTLFVDTQGYPEDDTNGTTWEVRAYPSLSNLVPLLAPESDFAVEPLPLGPPALIEDYPCFDDLEEEIDDDLWDAFQEQHETIPGVKLGGWPSLIQSEIFWAPFNKHPAKPQYVLQVDSLPEANWKWGHDGCAYIGRGTNKGHQHTWALDWQCL
jgi:uncharacterized protein YwqG